MEGSKLSLILKELYTSGKIGFSEANAIYGAVHIVNEELHGTTEGTPTLAGEAFVKEFGTIAASKITDLLEGD